MMMMKINFYMYVVAFLFVICAFIGVYADPCSPNPCCNGGTCIDNSASSVGNNSAQFLCLCTEGHSGSTCNCTVQVTTTFGELIVATHTTSGVTRLYSIFALCFICFICTVGAICAVWIK